MKRMTIKLTSVAVSIMMLLSLSVSYAYNTDDESYNTDSTTENTDDYTETYEDGVSDSDDVSDYESDETSSETSDSVEESDTDTSWYDEYDTEDEYTISTEGELRGLAELIKSHSFDGITIRLDSDIELSEEWNSAGDSQCYFSGTFDGQGHVISGLNINNESAYTGLFGYLAGKVCNLEVSGSIESFTESCGAIAGFLAETGSIESCTSYVEINAVSMVGGIVGENSGGTVKGCINWGSVSGTYRVGGIVGENWGGVIAKCANYGTITSTVHGYGTYGTGGVAGRSLLGSAKINNCFNSGDIISNNEATGGIVGYTNTIGSTIQNSYNVGNITVTEDSSDSAIADSAGGIAGVIGMTGVEIHRCYNIGAIEGAGITGGIVGKYTYSKDNDDDCIADNYYIGSNYSSAIGLLSGDENASVTGAASPVSRKKMMKLAGSLGDSFINDFGNACGNGGYPVLTWQDAVEYDDEFYDNIGNSLTELMEEYEFYQALTGMFGQTTFASCIKNDSDELIPLL